jgi:hypothetical protein
MHGLVAFQKGLARTHLVFFGREKGPADWIKQFWFLNVVGGTVFLVFLDASGTNVFGYQSWQAFAGKPGTCVSSGAVPIVYGKHGVLVASGKLLGY